MRFRTRPRSWPISLRLALSAAALLAGCTRGEPGPEAGTTVRDSAGIRIVENARPSWSTPGRVSADPSLTVGTVEADTSQLLFGVAGAARLDSGDLVIANGGTKELLFYDAQGRLLHRVGGEGEGPGEFSMLNGLSVFGRDSVAAIDTRGRRLSFFDPEARFLGSVDLEATAELAFPRPVGFFGDGGLLVTQGAFLLGAQGPTRIERPDQAVYRYGSDGRMLGELGTFPGREVDIAPNGTTRPDGTPVFMQSPREFGRSTAFASYARRFYVADNASWEIRAYDLEAGLELLIRKAFVPRPVTGEDLRAPREARLTREEDPERRRSIEQWYAARPDPPKTMPAFAAELRVDPAGDLWVKAYVPADLPSGDAPGDWDVFAPDGIWLGTVAIPPGLDLLSVGLDHIVGLRTDELGVQYVEVHELRKGASTS